MKKILALAALLCFAADTFSYAPKHGRTPERFAHVLRTCNTPSKTWPFLLEHIKYVPDRFSSYNDCIDYLQPAIDTYLLGEGDCEDIAYLAVAILKQHGYEAYPFVVQSRNDRWNGHAFAVIKEDNRWSVMSVEEKKPFANNARYERGYKSIQVIVETMRPDWGMYGLFTEDNTRSNGMRYTEVWFKNTNQWRYFTEKENTAQPPAKDFVEKKTLMHILNE